VNVSLLLAALLVCASLEAQTKPPWHWTDDERFKALVDPALRAERLRTAGEQHTPGPRERPAGDVINGREHPELFFPTQLFESMIRSSFVSLPSFYPRWIAQQSKDLFRVGSEWRKFEDLTREYAAILQAERDLLDSGHSTGHDQQLNAVRAKKCAAGAKR